jgi:adenosylcobinamide-phosphate synthase
MSHELRKAGTSTTFLHQKKAEGGACVGFAGAMAVAMVLDALMGWPDSLFARIGHPVTWLGRLIQALDTRWNHDKDTALIRRAAGIATALIVIAVASAVGGLLQAWLASGWNHVFVLGVLAWPFVALRSLYEHVSAVGRPLQSGDIDSARSAVSKIVGRDPAKLDEAGIARAAIESLAENASDGIVAPVFWGVLFGLPGIAGYKAINTLDSMIGHRSERYEHFGWAAARIDDVANFIPARLTGLIFALVSAEPKTALACMARDGSKHRSLNAGWPEAAMAGGLFVRLCGPRFYDGERADELWLNESARDPAAGDIALGLKLYVRAMAGLVGLLVILAFV